LTNPGCVIPATLTHTINPILKPPKT